MAGEFLTSMGLTAKLFLGTGWVDGNPGCPPIPPPPPEAPPEETNGEEEEDAGGGGGAEAATPESA